MSAAKSPLLRTSERRSFKRCPQQWWWAWREGLRPQGPPSLALWIGIGVHICLAEWYQPGFKRGPELQETWEKYCLEEIANYKARYRRLDLAPYREAYGLIDSVLESYREFYGEDEAWEFISPEYVGQVLIPSVPRVLYAFTFDGVFRNHALPETPIELVEHKTCKAIQTHHLELDDQAGGYWAIATTKLRADGVLGKNEHIAGIRYNFLRKARPDSRPRNENGHCLNKDGSISKRQPKPLFERPFIERTPVEQLVQVEHIISEAKHMQAFRRGTLPMYKSPTLDCKWDCPFFEMCKLHDARADWEEYRDMIFRVEDPYRDHRKVA